MSPTTAADGRLIPSDDEVAEMVFGQFPALAGRDIGRRYTMNDHVTVRIGDDYGVLIPTIEGQDHLYARVAALLAPLLPQWTFPCSAPLNTGRPSATYPYHFTIVPWLSGSTAAFVPLHDESAPALGDALRQIHSAPPADAPANPVTSIGLTALEDEWGRLLAKAVASGAPENRILDAGLAGAMWEHGSIPAVDVVTWTHGTLEPRSILSDRGAFAGVLIWHRFGAGDPAADLGFALNLVSRAQHDALLGAYGPISQDTATRMYGWQLLGAMRLIETGDPYLVRLAWERLIELNLVSEG